MMLALQSHVDGSAAKDSGCRIQPLDALASAACSAAAGAQLLDGALSASPASQPSSVSPPATPEQADILAPSTLCDTQAAMDLADLADLAGREYATCYTPSPRFEAIGAWRAGTGPAKEDLKVFQVIGEGASIGCANIGKPMHSSSCLLQHRGFGGMYLSCASQQHLC